MSSVSAPISDRREAIVDGEFAFTSQDFKRIAALLYDLAGISLPDSKATLVYSRLAKRLRSLGMRSLMNTAPSSPAIRGTTKARRCSGR